MSAKQAYDLIKAYKPICAEEKGFQRRMLDLLLSHENCFLRSCKDHHFTASALLLNKEKTHVLLMHHAKLDKWMQLGGHCDGNTDLLAVAIKEAQEESGIDEIRPLSAAVFDIDIHAIPAREAEESHSHFDVRFLLHAYNDDKEHKNHESKELRWVKIDSTDIPSQSKSVLKMFKKLAFVKVKENSIV